MRGDPSKRVNCYEGGGSWALCPNIRGYKNDGHKKLRQKALIFLRNYLTIILHLEKLPSFFPTSAHESNLGSVCGYNTAKIVSVVAKPPPLFMY